MEGTELGEDPLALEWPLDLKVGSEIETHLTCSICYGYLQTCVSLNCGHNYCSLCIRRTLSFKSECPTCRKHAAPGDLRPNRALDRIASLFAKLKKVLLAAEDDNEDEVEEQEEAKRNGRSKGSRPERRLPTTSYRLMKDNKLRELLRSQGLPVNGDRESLIWRHKEYVMLYNAECDKEERMLCSEIVEAVLKSEKERKKSTKQLSKDKALLGVKDGSWEKALESEKLTSNFAKLAEQARKSMSRTRKRPCPAKEPDDAGNGEVPDGKSEREESKAVSPLSSRAEPSSSLDDPNSESLEVTERVVYSGVLKRPFQYREGDSPRKAKQQRRQLEASTSERRKLVDAVTEYVSANLDFAAEALVEGTVLALDEMRTWVRVNPTQAAETLIQRAAEGETETEPRSSALSPSTAKKAMRIVEEVSGNLDLSEKGVIKSKSRDGTKARRGKTSLQLPHSELDESGANASLREEDRKSCNERENGEKGSTTKAVVGRAEGETIILDEDEPEGLPFSSESSRDSKSAASSSSASYTSLLQTTAQASVLPSTWACPRCTLENSSIGRSCMACEAPNPNAVATVRTRRQVRLTEVGVTPES